MADVETTPPEALSARAKGIVYAKTITSRRAQQRRTKRQAKREQAEAEDGTSAQETLLTTEGERKRKRETAPSVPAKKSKVATTVTAAGPVLGPKVAVRETAPPTLAKKRMVTATAATVLVRGPKRSGHSQATEWAAHERADYEARIMRYQEEIDQLRAELARVLANAGASTASAMRPFSPLGPSDVVLLPFSAASLQDTFEAAAPSSAIGNDPSRDFATSSPQVCSWIESQLSPITVAVPTTTPPTATSASEPTYDALDCLLYSGDVDAIMDYQMQYLWTNFDDDAALGVVVAEPPVTTSTTVNEDAHSNS